MAGGEYVRWLEQGELAAAVAGGKGAALSRLIRAAFPVPEGFVVTTAAYRCPAPGVRPGEPALLAACSSASSKAGLARRNWRDEGRIAPPVALAILTAYRQLSGEEPGGALVAVRSSATLEDGRETSFAGQGATFLNVRGEAEVLDAVARCWISLWSSPSLAYLANLEIDPASAAMAVVVQRMVQAVAAGVLFTVDPLTGNSRELVIEMAPGPCDAVVSGRVTPQQLRVDRHTGHVLSVVGPAGMEVPETPPGRLPLLSPARLQELVRLCLEVEAQSGSPQDIEWAVAEDRVYVLQARPITAIPTPLAGKEPDTPIPGPDGDDWPALDDRPSSQPFDLWTRLNVGEGWPDPVTPLTWSVIPYAMHRGLEHRLRWAPRSRLKKLRLIARFYGRVYYNEGAFEHLAAQELGFPAWLTSRAFGSRAAGTPSGKDLHPGRMVRKPPVLAALLAGQVHAACALPGWFRRVNRWTRSFDRQDLETLADRDLAKRVAKPWAERSLRLLATYTQVNDAAAGAHALLAVLLKRWGGHEELMPELIAGLSGVHAAGMAAHLRKIAATLQQSGLAPVVLDQEPRRAWSRLHDTPAAAVALEQVREFLQEYGHRCPGEAEALHPRWAEAPERVIELAAGYLRAGGAAGLPGEKEDTAHRSNEAALRVEASLDPLRRLCFRGLLRMARALVRLRDNGKDCLMKSAFPLRRVCDLLSRRWVERGWLERPDQFYFLAVPEILAVIRAGAPERAGLELLAITRPRERAYRYWHSIPAPEPLQPDGLPVDRNPESADRAVSLAGTPASGGRTRGRARVVSDPRDAARLQPGDILVTRAADTGWTPVFPLVSGLVLETGGQLSHGAIVAREYGVPAVVSAAGAMRRIRDGQTVLLDGTTGHIYLE